MSQYIIFAGQHPWMFTLLGIIVVLIIGDEIWRRLRQFHELSPQEAVRLLNSGARIIDCRDDKAYSMGHVVGSKHIPMSELADQADTLKRKRAKPVIIIGDTAREDQRAAQLLSRAGVEQIHILKGGLKAWQREKLPLEDTKPSR